MNKKQLLYIIGGIVIALIVLFLVIHLVLGSVRNGSGSSGYSNPPARLVQVMTHHIATGAVNAYSLTATTVEAILAFNGK